MVESFSNIDYSGLPADIQQDAAALDHHFYGFHRNWPDLTFYGNIPAKYSENTVSWIEWMAWMESWIAETAKKLDEENQDFNNFIKHYNQFITTLPQNIVDVINAFFKGTSLQGHPVTEDDYVLDAFKIMENMFNAGNLRVPETFNMGISQDWASVYSGSNNGPGGVVTNDNMPRTNLMNILIAGRVNGSWQYLSTYPEQLNQMRNNFFTGYNPGESPLQPPTSSGVNTIAPTDITVFSPFAAGLIPDDVLRVFPIASSNGDGGVVFMDDNRRIYWAGIGDSSATYLPTEKAPLFILNAKRGTFGTPGPGNIQLDYIADDYSVNVMYANVDTTGELKLFDKLPDNIINSIQNLRHEKVIGNAFQIAALVPGNTGDNGETYEQIVTWNLFESPLENSNNYEAPFTPRRLVDYPQFITPGQNKIWYNLTPNVFQGGLYENYGLEKGFETGKQENSTPRDTYQGVKTLADAKASDEIAKTQAQRNQAIDDQVNKLVASINNSTTLTQDEKNKQIQLAQQAAETDKSNIHASMQNVTTASPFNGYSRSSYGFLFVWNQTVQPTKSDVTANITGTQHGGPTLFHNQLFGGFLRAHADPSPVDTINALQIAGLYEDAKDQQNRLNQINWSNIQFYKDLVGRIYDDEAKEAQDKADTDKSLSDAFKQIQDAFKDITDLYNKLSGMGDKLNKLIGNLEGTGAWDADTNDFVPGRNLTTGNINWYAQQADGTNGLFAHTIGQDQYGDGVFGVNGGSGGTNNVAASQSTSQSQSTSASLADAQANAAAVASASTSASTSQSINDSQNQANQSSLTASTAASQNASVNNSQSTSQSITDSQNAGNASASTSTSLSKSSSLSSVINSYSTSSSIVTSNSNSVLTSYSNFIAQQLSTWDPTNPYNHTWSDSVSRRWDFQSTRNSEYDSTTAAGIGYGNRGSVSALNSTIKEFNSEFDSGEAVWNANTSISQSYSSSLLGSNNTSQSSSISASTSTSTSGFVSQWTSLSNANPNVYTWWGFDTSESYDKALSEAWSASNFNDFNSISASGSTLDSESLSVQTSQSSAANNPSTSASTSSSTSTSRSQILSLYNTILSTDNSTMSALANDTTSAGQSQRQSASANAVSYIGMDINTLISTVSSQSTSASLQASTLVSQFESEG